MTWFKIYFESRDEFTNELGIEFKKEKSRIIPKQLVPFNELKTPERTSFGK